MEGKFGNPYVLIGQVHREKMSNDLVGSEQWTSDVARIQELQDAKNTKVQ